MQNMYRLGVIRSEIVCELANTRKSALDLASFADTLHRQSNQTLDEAAELMERAAGLLNKISIQEFNEVAKLLQRADVLLGEESAWRRAYAEYDGNEGVDFDPQHSEHYRPFKGAFDRIRDTGERRRRTDPEFVASYLEGFTNSVGDDTSTES